MTTMPAVPKISEAQITKFLRWLARRSLSSRSAG